MKKAALVLTLLLVGGGARGSLMLKSLSGDAPRDAARPAPGKAASGQLDQLENALIHNNRGVSRLEQYDYRRAAEEFRRALESKPDFLPAMVNLGIALYYDADYQKAAEQLQAALKLDAKQPHAHFMLGLLYSKEYKKDEALQEFQKVAALYPDDSATNYNLGLTLMRARDYEGAIGYFQKVLQTEPRHLSAMYNLGMALMRAGKRDEAQKIMTQLRGLKGEEQQGGSPMGAMGTQYQDEGRFAIAIGEYDAEVPASAAPATTVSFLDATSKAGIKFVHAGARGGLPGFPKITEVSASRYSKDWAEKNLVPAFGSGAAFLDYNLDGRLDLYLVNCGPDGKSPDALYRGNGDGTFTDASAEAGVSMMAGRGMGVAVGDYNSDGWPDLYLTRYGRNALLRNDKNGRFTDVTAEAGVGGAEGKWSLSAAFFDFDHDGDLDLYVCNFVDLAKAPSGQSFRFPADFPGQPNLLYRNNGNGTFTETALQAKVDNAAGISTGLVILDYNESRDIDFCVQGYGSAVRLFSNNRDGSFTDVADQAGLGRLTAWLGLSAGDLNKDGYPDLYFPAPDGAAGGRVMYNQAGRTFRGAEIGSSSAGPGRGSAFSVSAILDYDNDGDLDIFGTGERPYLLRNDGKGEFKDVSAASGLDKVNPPASRSMALGDYDADGDVDLLVAQNGGSPVLLANGGGNRNNYLRVNLTALNDNKLGIGSKVEIRSGSLWQKIDVTGNCGYLSQGTTDVIFGLGARKTVDAVKILWPTGVLQAEIEPQANTLLKIQQVDRKGTSCPILYAWNGAGYRFVTDFLGGSAFGNLLAPGRYNSTDTDEYILLKPEQLKSREGAYSIKMNNQLEEVIFLDQAKLIALDHPADTQVYPNERLMPAPPFPEYGLFITKDARPPVSAMDDHGHDVLPQIRSIDRQYPGDFKLLPFKGYAEEHSLILDLGDLSPAKKTVLLMNAWIDYADSTSNLAASQAKVRLVPPYLQVVNERGEWVTVLENMGFPAGLPKTMTVDLTGKFLNTRDHRIRIITNMRIYWDQILVGTHAGSDRIRMATLDPSLTTLAWGGYPREFSPDGKKPRLYDYSVRDQSAPWKSHAGAYTRYGDVGELIRGKDNLYVIMRHGDEVTLDFNARALPPPPGGWTRSFLVYAVGFGKDMDVNSAYPDTIEPLPFHGMPGYPYRGSFPGGSRWAGYNAEYNTRIIPRIYFGNGDLRSYIGADETFSHTGTR